jgi:hypothetical protein
MVNWRRIGLATLLLIGGVTTALATSRQDKDVCNHYAHQLLEGPSGLKAGDWGTVPQELQKLPPGAKLCGSQGGGFLTVIASPLEGKALQDYYTPLMAKAGCPNLTCKINLAQTDCSCQHPTKYGGPGTGRLLTDTGLALYKLFY